MKQTRQVAIPKSAGSAGQVFIRPPAPADADEFLTAVGGSVALHRPWASPPASEAQFAAWLRQMSEPQNHAFLICEKGSGQIAGVVNLTNVILGVFRSGYLGYYAFAGFERRGLMRAGLSLVARHAFRQLKLHRLEANIQPQNLASIALVRACGFQREGYSPKYLKLGGQWRDHERWALLASA